MKKNIGITLMILVFLGCSEKEPVPKTPVKKKVEIRVTEKKPVPKTLVKEKVEIRVTEKKPTIPVDFVPEHIRKSHIEVVRHY